MYSVNQEVVKVSVSYGLEPRGYSITFDTRVHANIWGPKLDIKSIFGVWTKHGKNSIFWAHKSEKGRIVEFGVGFQNIRLNIWGSQNIRLDT